MICKLCGTKHRKYRSFKEKVLDAYRAFKCPNFRLLKAHKGKVRKEKPNENTSPAYNPTSTTTKEHYLKLSDVVKADN